MYVYDERFNKFYTENVGCGTAELLKDEIIEFYS